jgi:hypothetical protein
MRPLAFYFERESVTAPAPLRSACRSHRRCTAHFAIGLKLTLRVQTIRPMAAPFRLQWLVFGHSRSAGAASVTDSG